MVLLTYACAVTAGCMSWRPVPDADIADADWEHLVGKRVELTTDEEVVRMLVRWVEYPIIQGHDPRTGQGLRVDLTQVTEIRIGETDVPKTTLAVVGGIVVFAAVLGVAILVIDTTQ